MLENELRKEEEKVFLMLIFLHIKCIFYQ